MADKLPRVTVPIGQTPLDDALGHRYLDVINEGSSARDTGAGNPYHGHSLEHCLHAAGWVSRDLRLALDESREYATALTQELRDRAEQKPPRMAEGDFDCLILDAMAEAMKAIKKFPQPNYVISKIAEEAGEVVKASIHCAEGRETAENLRGEMKQLIAMLYRLWVEGDGVHGLKSVSAMLAARPAK